jgi:signal peptidase I
MYPTYENGDRFFVIKDWLVSEYEYGDVVCADVDGMTIIKRVIGLPGDVIEIKDNAVYRNGEKVDESEYLSDDVKTTVKGIMHKFVLGDDQYFLLGDNRPNSQDSRYYGLFDELKGKTFFFFKKSWFK